MGKLHSKLKVGEQFQLINTGNEWLRYEKVRARRSRDPFKYSKPDRKGDFYHVNTKRYVISLKKIVWDLVYIWPDIEVFVLDPIKITRNTRPFSVPRIIAVKLDRSIKIGDPVYQRDVEDVVNMKTRTGRLKE